MLIAIMLAAAVILVIGAVLVIKGLKEAEVEAAVPIRDIKEIRKLEKKSPEVRPTLAATPQPEPATDGKIKEELEQLRRKNQDLSAENERLNEALKKEMAAQNMKTISVEEQKTLAEREQRFALAQQSLDQITKENLQMKDQLKNEKDNAACLEKTIESLKNEKSQIEMRETLKINDLNREVGGLRLVQEEVERHKQSLAKVERDFYDAKQHKEAAEEKLKMLERDYEERLEKSKEHFESLSLQQQATIQKQVQLIGERLSEAMATIAALKKEKEDWHKNNEGAVLEQQKTRDLNTQLAERERQLQYELTKSRAQALGLEKICEDFKLQIEEMAKVISGSKNSVV